MPIGNIKPGGTIDMQEWEKKQLLARLSRSYDESRRFFEPIRIRWWMVGRYLEGFQYSISNWNNWQTGAAADFLRTQTTGNVDDEYFIDNIMVRVHVMIMTRLTRYQPSISVFPNSEQESDKSACRSGRTFLYDLIQRNDWPRLMQKTARLLNCYGKVFWKTTFNPNRGKKIMRPYAELQGIGPDGEPIYTYNDKEEPEGEIQIDVISPRNILVPPRTADLETADWIQETNVRTVEYIFREYGVVVKEESIGPESYEFSGPFATGYYSRDFKEETISKDAKVALVKERWYRPCPDFPQGAIITWSGTGDTGTILRSSTLTDFYDDIPYEDADFIFVDGAFWGDTLMYHIIPHQDEINRLESEIMRHTKIMAKPKILVNTQTQISDKDFTDETGEFIRYFGDKPPQYLQAPELPQTVYENLNRMFTRITQLAAVQDMTRPDHNRSGNSIAFEQELDESTLAPAVQSMERMASRSFGKALKMCADYYDTPRMIRMTGKDGWTIINDFDGAFLNKNFTANVSMMAGLPVNKLAREQAIYQALDRGVVSKDEAAVYLEFGEKEEMEQELRAEKEIAERTARIMEMGNMVPVHPWDNHQVFMEVLTRHMRQNYENWRKEGKLQVMQFFDESLQMHQQALTLMQHPGQAQTGPISGLVSPENPGMAAQASPGGPGSPPGGPPQAAAGQQPPNPLSGAPSGQQLGQAQRNMMAEIKPAAGQLHTL